jgi:hypothetical protein
LWCTTREEEKKKNQLNCVKAPLQHGPLLLDDGMVLQRLTHYMQDPIHTARAPPFCVLKEFKDFFHFQEMQKNISHKKT